jgi:CubicO group peptidase (beta-lactamase class C family)
MDSELLAKMFEHIDRNRINLHSVLIVRNGYVVTEAYFHPYTADTAHQVASITKSIISALLGIATDRGSIRDVDQPLLDFFPGRWIANVDAKTSHYVGTSSHDDLRLGMRRSLGHG